MLLKSSDSTQWWQRRLLSCRDAIQRRQKKLLNSSEIRQILSHSATHPRTANVARGSGDVRSSVCTESWSQSSAYLLHPKSQFRTHNEMHDLTSNNYLGLILFEDGMSGKFRFLLISKAIDEQLKQAETFHAKGITIGCGGDKRQTN